MEALEKIDPQAEVDTDSLRQGMQKLFMRLLLVVGLFLVLFSGQLAHGFVPKEQVGMNTLQWNGDQERDIVVVVRILGVMIFASGLIERLALAITHAGKRERV